MNRLSILSTTLILFAATQITFAAEAVNLEEFVGRFIKAENQAWQQGEFAALEAIEDPAIVFHGMGLNGWEAHKQYIINARQTITGLQQDWEYLTGDGNLFALSYKSTSTISGQKSRTEALMLFRLENGRIKDVWLNASTTNPVE